MSDPGAQAGGGGRGDPVEPGNLGDSWDEDEPWRLRDHIGVISGIVLGLVALAVLSLIAAAGDPGAFGILVVVVIGVALIFFGSQLHSSRRRR